MRPRFRMLAVAAATLTFAACGGDSNAPAAGVVGHYRLVSIDGDHVPITIPIDPTLTLTIRSGSLTLNAGNTFTQTVDIEAQTNGLPIPSQSLTCSGNYSHSGNTVTLTGVASPGCESSTATGTLSGNTLTVDDQGSVIIFER